MEKVPLDDGDPYPDPPPHPNPIPTEELRSAFYGAPSLPNPARTYTLRYAEPSVRAGKLTVYWEEKTVDLETEDYFEAKKRAESFLSRGGVIIDGETHRRKRVEDIFKK